MNLSKLKRIASEGFTLIELLVVIAVLGVLATVVLAAINPAEQLARARDSGRKTTVSQLGNAVQAYYTSRGNYLASNVGATWISVSLVNAGEVKRAPAAITYTVSGMSACTTNVENGWCYSSNNTGTSATEAMVYTSLESGSEKSKCTSTQGTFFVWDSERGSACIVCTALPATQPGLNATCNTVQ